MTTECKAAKHSDTNWAWDNGCRHPGAIEAHRKWLAEGKGRMTKVPPAVDESGRCVAAKHGSRHAYIAAGCRHPEAIEKYEKYLKRRNCDAQNRRDADQAFVWMRDSARAKRMTGGRLEQDPRRPWRGGRMAVDRNNLRWMFLHGFASASQGEKMAALNRLEGTMVAGDGWLEKPHRITATEIAQRLGVTLTGVKSLRARQIELATERTQRRLADRQWKVAVAEHAVGRKGQARLDHEQAHARRVARRQIWEGGRAQRWGADQIREGRRTLHMLDEEREQACRG